MTGRQAMAEIDRGLETLRKEEERLTRDLSAVTDKIAKAQADETAALSDLAKFKLAADGESVGTRLDQASKQAGDLMAAREKAIAELEKERSEKGAALAELQKNLEALRGELEEVEDRIEELTPQVEEKLAGDEAHQQLVEAADAAAATAENAAKKAEQAETDRKEKSVAYQKDMLFMYLWQRHFGTPQYRHGGLTRTLDRWVSNLIGYLEARPSFVLLNEIPARLSKHAERVAEAATEAAKAVAESANRALAEVAGEDLAGRADALATGIATQEEAIEPVEAEVASLDQRAAAFAAGEDDMFKQAIDALSRSIATEDIRALREEAEATPSPEDERFVERLGRARSEIARLQPDADKLRKDVDAVSERRQDLLKVARDFRRRGWEHRGHSFDFGDMMTGFMLGRISRGMFWGGISRSHRGISHGRGGGFGGFGGFGGGGFSGGGGFGGGGFRTGGGF
jgi:chromosome segregation ATPase